MKNKEIVAKMLSYVEKIISYTESMTYDEFIKNSILTEACVFNLSQIGELTKRLDTDFAAEHSYISWNQIGGLRNRIVHDYEGVNLILIWEIIKNDLPELKDNLQRLT